uniref:rho GTPase-activating protein 15-like isoform X2 n=1 Tax=Myxine glutinosa TaxID=7769 RepID=UPI00358EAB1A
MQATPDTTLPCPQPPNTMLDSQVEENGEHQNNLYRNVMDLTLCKETDLQSPPCDVTSSPTSPHRTSGLEALTTPTSDSRHSLPQTEEADQNTDSQDASPAHSCGPPPGWTEISTPGVGTVYVHPSGRQQWKRMLDATAGCVYFYEESTNETRCELPPLSPIQLSNHDKEKRPSSHKIDRMHNTKSLYVHSATTKNKGHRRSLSNTSLDTAENPPLSIKDLHKEGMLCCAKVAKGDKKLKKTWVDACIRLGRTAIYLKEMQGAWVSKLGQSTTKNWVEVVLQGANVVAGSNHSAKKNIIQLTTADKEVYLLHNEKEEVCKEWMSSLQAVISQLPCNELTTETGRVVEEKHVLPSRRIIWPVTRSNSNTETMDRHSIKNKLRKFIVRRPTRQILEAKGILKEQVFGCHLRTLCQRESSTIPKFVRLCVQAIDKRGLKIDGIYRVSGNLATIQKLRYIVDHDGCAGGGKLNLDEAEWHDVHVITGALKLFFRELSEPLLLNTFIAAAQLATHEEKVQTMRNLIQQLPTPNHDTAHFLFHHLQRVVENRLDNRMCMQNLAILFGPTLLRPDLDGGCPAIHAMHQSQVIEVILSDVNSFFPA